MYLDIFRSSRFKYQYVNYLNVVLGSQHPMSNVVCYNPKVVLAIICQCHYYHWQSLDYLVHSLKHIVKKRWDLPWVGFMDPKALRSYLIKFGRSYRCSKIWPLIRYVYKHSTLRVISFSREKADIYMGIQDYNCGDIMKTMLDHLNVQILICFIY